MPRRQPIKPVHLLLAAVLSAAASPAHADGEPNTIAKAIYAQVFASCQGTDAPMYDLNAIAKAYFEPGLAQKLEASDEGTMLGFDVLIDGQDCKVADVRTTTVSEDAGKATVRVNFTNFEEKRAVDLVMTKIGPAWKVDDVVYGHRDFSLRKELK